MDAQSAAAPDRSKSAVASPKRRRASLVDQKSITVASGPPTNKDGPTKRDSTKSDDDQDSDAETIVLPGKDGHSPSKVRKVRQEDKDGSDGERPRDRRRSTRDDHADGLRRKKRISSRPDKDLRSHNDDSEHSDQSSNPPSPEMTQRRLQHRRRRSELPDVSDSDSDPSDRKSSTKSNRERSRGGDRSVSLKRKTPKMESDDELDNRKARRQRTTSAGADNHRNYRESRMRSQRDGRANSNSPPPRQHRRSASNQLQSSGFGQKKKRLPPPLQTDYNSDESSSSDSPHPRNAKVRSLATPSHNDSAMSPAKAGVHKKHLDAHGQTLLARACARGEYDGAKQRLMERPEDLNVADYAGNTPLQIAAINGCEDIVQLLIEAGCNLDCVNYDKETPLLDAVDNGHLGVVKLLLAAGVNPRKANVNGEEPIDRVNEDTENGDEIRAALVQARKKAGDRRRTSEEHHSNNERDGQSADSPRNSPAPSLAAGRRGTNVRSTKTRNDLLYMPLDEKTLRQAAGRGDEETVARILQVKEGFDDPESMVAAARGGHDLVIQLLLGLGSANADPAPVSSLAPEFATPILASIGQENIKVVELLLEQQGFDPTRRFKGETYYEIARRRQGTNWKEEEHILKDAYDAYKRSNKDSTNTKSPGRRDKERAREEKRARREEAKNAMRDAEGKKKTTSTVKLGSPTGKRRSDSFSTVGDEDTPKRGPGRPRKEDKDGHKAGRAKPAESDAGGVSSDGESTKPRRKLVSKGDLRGERDKGKRDSKRDESPDRQRLSEKYRDRTKAIKRDEGKDADASSKRHRSSTTPDRPSDADKDDSEAAPIKRRRLEQEIQERRAKRTESTDDRPSKTKPTRSNDGKDSDGAARRSTSGDPSITVKSEDADVDMADGNSLHEIPRKSSAATDDSKDESEKKPSKQDLAKRAAAEEKRKEEEQEKRRQDEEARKAREAEEAAQREAANKKRKEEEAERKQREDEERRRLEKLEREAAEEAKRIQDEEDRKERERRERLHREEVERKRAAREAEARRIREEQELARLDKLPGLLRWLHICPNPKAAAVADMFKSMLGIRYDTIRQEANGTPEGREQWVLNTHVALLLGEKDLDLSRYTAWERIPVSRLGKITVWRTEWSRYSLLAEKLWDLGRQIPGYYGDEDPATMNFHAKEALKKAAWERFLSTDLFFVKLSDLLYTVPNIPHLRNLKLAIEYRELLESEAQASTWHAGQKWRQDPDADRFYGFAPRHKYYLNGVFVGEDMPTKHQTSKTPFPEHRVPRRGLVQAFPSDPDYETLCTEQGLSHLLKVQDAAPASNGVHDIPVAAPMVNGTNGHGLDGKSANGINGVN